MKQQLRKTTTRKPIQNENANIETLLPAWKYHSYRNCRLQGQQDPHARREHNALVYDNLRDICYRGS